MERQKSLLVAVMGVFAVLLASGCTTDEAVTGEVISTETGVIKIPVSDITNQAKFFSHNDGGNEVRFFAVRGSDGIIRTAFDACDVCGGKKGYRQQGNDMLCNNCGLFFDIDDLGRKNRGGGCWPTYLSHEVQGNYVIIKESELSAGKWMF